MSLFILDSDTVSLAARGHALVLARIGRALTTDQVKISVVTIREMMEGRLSQIKRARNPVQTLTAYDGLKLAAEYLRPYLVASFSPASLARFDALVAMKLNVGKDDLRIAAIALDAGGIVVTSNLRDFRRVPGISCEDWSV
jgi:tRNA(fMet)-specific endonuclease VapC